MWYNNFIDINECATDDGRCHNCTNTDGSYECQCREGFELVVSEEGLKFCQG